MTFKREIRGVVVKITGDKTANILVERKATHPRYRKVVKCFRKYLIYNERNETKVGDVVAAVECRSTSERKPPRLEPVLVAGAEL